MGSLARLSVMAAAVLGSTMSVGKYFEDEKPKAKKYKGGGPLGTAFTRGRKHNQRTSRSNRSKAKSKAKIRARRK